MAPGTSSSSSSSSCPRVLRERAERAASLATVPRAPHSGPAPRPQGPRPRPAEHGGARGGAHAEAHSVASSPLTCRSARATARTRTNSGEGAGGRGVISSAREIRRCSPTTIGRRRTTTTTEDGGARRMLATRARMRVCRDCAADGPLLDADFACCEQSRCARRRGVCFQVPRGRVPSPSPGRRAT